MRTGHDNPARFAEAGGVEAMLQLLRLPELSSDLMLAVLRTLKNAVLEGMNAVPDAAEPSLLPASVKQLLGRAGMADLVEVLGRHKSNAEIMEQLLQLGASLVARGARGAARRLLMLVPRRQQQRAVHRGQRLAAASACHVRAQS